MRLFSSLSHYLATVNESSVQIHQYATAQLDVDVQDAPVQIAMETAYPWQGQVAFTINATPASPWVLSLRLPDWCRLYDLTLNGAAVGSQLGDNGYLTLARNWQAGDVLRLDLQTEPMFMAPHPRIDALRGCVSIQRGPLVYAFESQDQSEGISLEDVQVLVDEALAETAVSTGSRQAVSASSRQAVSFPTHSIAIQASGLTLPATWGDSLYLPLAEQPKTEAQPVQLNAIPYFLWGNRGMDSMRVWVPQARDRI
jgi:DUF1680 family protein